MEKLFGTDGIRGVANTYPMTAEMAMKTGQAVALFSKKQGYSQIVIGKDTRLSGDMLEAALTAGITSMGLDVLSAGVIPTPGVAYLTAQNEKAGAGIVISASHNPYQDNGIKLFKHDGYKLDNAEERRIEIEILAKQKNSQVDHIIEPGRLIHIDDAREQYAEFLRKSLVPDKPLLENLKMVIDCSNGAAFNMAPLVFNFPLFETTFLFNTPNGKNINRECGSQHTEILSKAVIDSRADLGLAFDGDADRLIAIDEKGKKVTGDILLAICAAHAKSQNALPGNRVVSTVMSNIGLSQTLKSLDIAHEITGVGDRDVLLKMLETGAVMGGEDSGHMIFTDCHTTGDGILTAFKLIKVILETGKKLSKLSKIMTVFPQILMNVEVNADKPDFTKVTEIVQVIDEVETELGDKGRVLVRYSGTQPLLRVMVEGPDIKITQSSCERICETIQQHLIVQQA